MIRTQVYLTPQQYQKIHALAAQKKKPAALVMRELVDKGLKHKNLLTGKQALLELVKIGKKVKATGPTDLSENIDKYLYDE